MTLNDDLRAELAEVAASLRAYLEVQADSGATGIPRRTTRARQSAITGPATPPTLEPAPPLTPAPTLEPAPSLTPAPAPSPAGATPTRSLTEVAKAVAECTRCPLHATRTQTVFSRGNPQSSICFV